MASLFCCNKVQPFRPARVEHELKFSSFVTWSRPPRSASPYGSAVENENDKSATSLTWPYALQLVRQVNYGPLESKRYFVPQEPKVDSEKAFEEILENDLLEANFSKVNSYKNFRCEVHNKFFELNLYAKDPINRHHWRVNIARPADSIDLANAGPSTQISGLTAATSQISSAAIQESESEEESDGGTSTAPSTVTLAAPSILSVTRSLSRTTISDGDESPTSIEKGNYSYSRDYGYHSENDNDKDYTACSKECGYCGDCDY